MAYNKKGYNIRSQAILKIVEERYTPGSYRYSLKTVWKYYIYPIWGISYRTLLTIVKKQRNENKFN